MFNKLEARVLSEYKRSWAAPSTFCTLIKHYFSFIKHYIKYPYPYNKYIYYIHILYITFCIVYNSRKMHLHLYRMTKPTKICWFFNKIYFLVIVSFLPLSSNVAYLQQIIPPPEIQRGFFFLFNWLSRLICRLILQENIFLFEIQ